MHVFDCSGWVCNSELVYIPCSEREIAELLTSFLVPTAVAFSHSEISITFSITEERLHMPAI